MQRMKKEKKKDLHVKLKYRKITLLLTYTQYTTLYHKGNKEIINNYETIKVE